jgi:hypothetical protein
MMHTPQISDWVISHLQGQTPSSFAHTPNARTLLRPLPAFDREGSIELTCQQPHPHQPEPLGRCDIQSVGKPNHIILDGERYFRTGFYKRYLDGSGFSTHKSVRHHIGQQLVGDDAQPDRVLASISASSNSFFSVTF